MITLLTGAFLLILSLSNLLVFSGVFVLILFIAFRFFRAGINEVKNKNTELEHQVDELRLQLESSMEKESLARKSAEKIDIAKGKLLSSMSHEIRTPMNGVIGMATLLAETTLNEEQREYTETILGCGKGLLTKVNDILISDMLDYSKIDSNNGETNNKKFDLRNCVEEVLDMFGGKVAETGIDLIYQLDSNIPQQIVGDSKRLRQVLINLVENAFKFTKQGEIFVGVQLLNTENDQVKLAFEVTDSGIGIDAETSDKIFTAFLPADYSTKNKQVGAGFGLVICKKLIELMGGEIRAEKRARNGTSFKFTIVADECDEPQNYGKQNMIGFGGENILIVDDNLTSRNVLKSQLEQWKLMPVLADTGKQALESLTQISFDLVIVDLNMPEMDGIQLARKIKERYPKIPIILLNPLNDERHKKDAEIFGAIINKPVRQHTLFDNILSQLRHKNKATAHENVTHKMTAEFSQLYPLRILIAEDNPINQKWITKILTRLGYKYKMGNNGKEVLEIVSHEHYDLILMDVQMPEMDGLEATKMIRVCLEIQPVIIAMTANVMQGDREDCMQAGMDDYISKPVELVQLVNMLEKWSLVIKEKGELSFVEKNI
ncbi:MAG: response regulator [Ginsengibacter sp.]